MPEPDEPVAIIGMGCLFPNAPGLKEFWRLVRCGLDGITEVPATHWSAKDFYDADPKARLRGSLRKNECVGNRRGVFRIGSRDRLPPREIVAQHCLIHDQTAPGFEDPLELVERIGRAHGDDRRPEAGPPDQVENGKLALGTWQGIFFCEFDGPRDRKVYVTALS